MNRIMFQKFLGDSCVWGADDPNGPVKHVWFDGVQSHNGDMGPDAASKKIERHHLPPNTTHICQPCDQFVIAQIKSLYKEYFDDYVIQAVEDGLFQQKVEVTGNIKGSGKLRNPGKKFILMLLAKVIAEVNTKIDENGYNWARKAMLGCGIGLDNMGRWSKEMLFPKLRRIIDAYPEYFELRSSPFRDAASEEKQSEDVNGEQGEDGLHAGDEHDANHAVILEQVGGVPDNVEGRDGEGRDGEGVELAEDAFEHDGPEGAEGVEVADGIETNSNCEPDGVVAEAIEDNYSNAESEGVSLMGRRPRRHRLIPNKDQENDALIAALLAGADVPDDVDYNFVDDDYRDSEFDDD